MCPYSLDVPGGVGTHVLGLGAWLRRQGHDVQLVAPGTPAGRRTLVDQVVEHRLGRSCAVVFNGSTARLALDPRQAREAVRASAAADVVHVHEPLTPGVAFAVARSASALVVTHHAAFEPGPLLRALLRRRAAGLGTRESLAVSPSAAATALAVTGLPAAVVPNAVVLPPAPARGPRRPGGPAVVGFLGRANDPRKGYPLFCQVARRSEQLGLPVRFEAVGPGTAGADLVVRGRGELPSAARDAWLAGVDVLLAPNTGGESFGLVLVEALAAGCDVVASDLPAFRAVLQRAGVGRTFTVGDPGSATAALSDALAHPTDPRTCHAAAAHWGWDTVGPRVVAAYQKARLTPGNAEADGLGLAG